jgi:uroporphyrinogen decarboxylase
MNNRERVKATLERRPVDRIAYHDGPWGETITRWVAEGQFPPGGDIIEIFGMAFRSGGWLDSQAHPGQSDTIIEETGETVLRRNSNGAILRWHKLHSSTPEHVAFEVTDRAGWDRLIRPNLLPLNRARIPFESYRAAKAKAAANREFFVWSGVPPFEQMHPMCGHENMLIGMADDPDWVLDMAMVYAEMTIRHLEVLFAEEGLPDGVWVYEDMGFKDRPFMSPAMYESLIQPAHAKLFGWLHGRGLKVIVHSCGFVEALVPGLIDAGMDMLQAMEVKAGMDLPRLARAHGKRIGFMGGFDVRTLLSNDRKLIDAEFDRVVRPVLDMGVPYILHSDHSIPPEADADTIRYFFCRGVELSRR